jgi:sensor histidine kinase YesM
VAVRPWTVLIRALVEGVLATLGVALALLLLRWLHGQWLPRDAMLVGLGGPVAVRILVRAASERQFPSFLVRILDGLAVVAGTALGAWITLVDEPLATLVLRWREGTAIGLLVLGLGAALVGLVYTHTRMAAEVEAREARLRGAREATLRARLSALQAQINPHFLFNTLNNLAELAHRDASATEQLVTDLAWLMRYTLQSSAAPRVRLVEELEAVRRTVRIEQRRLGPRLKVAVDVAPELDDVEVPGLCLQPLVENAIKYGARAGVGDVVVAVEVEEADRRLRCVVEDNGPGLPEGVRRRLRGEDGALDGGGTGGAGGGLRNVWERVALLHPGEASLRELERERGTALCLELPLHPAAGRSEVRP